MWRPKPESNRRGRICKPGLKSFITVACSLFGVPLVGDFLCFAGRIPPRLGLRLWTQKNINFTALCWLSKIQGSVPTRLAPHSSWTYSAPVNTGLQQQALAATTPNAAGYRVTMSLEKSLRLFSPILASCRTSTTPTYTRKPPKPAPTRTQFADNTQPATTTLTPCSTTRR